MKIKGIYKITTKHNNKYYIGSSVDIYKRWNDHLHKMSCQKHANSFLQNVYNKYGVEDFEFSIIKEMQNSSNEEIRKEEQKILDKIFKEDKENIYNLASHANGGNSTKISLESLQSISNKNRKCSEEDLNWIKQQLEKGRTKKVIAEELHINNGVLSQWIKKYLPEYNETKLKRNRIKTFLQLKEEGWYQKDIAKLLGVSVMTISNYNKDTLEQYKAKPSNRFSEEEIKKIKQYKEQGYGNVKIAEFLNSDHTTIQTWILWMEELERDEWWQATVATYT